MNKKLFKKRAKEALRSYTKDELQGIDFDNPTVEMLEKIADMGEVSVDWLLGRDQKDVIEKTLSKSIIHGAVDTMAGKELIEYSKWARNYCSGEITEGDIRDTYPVFRRGRRISPMERDMLELIYQEAIIEALCPKTK